MTSKENESGIIGHFSVALGLFDYINPIFYGVTVITIMIKMFGVMSIPTYILFVVGAVISLIFGLSIPTVKLIVGLGKMQFKMPVNLVSFVNTGILLSGIALVSHIVGVKPLTLIIVLLCAAGIIGFLWYKTGKFNTVAVLIGFYSNKKAPEYLNFKYPGAFIFVCCIGFSLSIFSIHHLYTNSAWGCMEVHYFYRKSKKI